MEGPASSLASVDCAFPFPLPFSCLETEVPVLRFALLSPPAFLVLLLTNPRKTADLRDTAKPFRSSAGRANGWFQVCSAETLLVVSASGRC